MPLATWENGNRSVSGNWVFNWAANRFVITLDQKDRVTGQPRMVYAYGDYPEWGNWKLKPEVISQ